ncbi:MAG: acetolactate synthase, large subunit, biosynthetic type [Nitrospiraceae bacterium]|nr:acetolactate synthase, large subunit, biosynthetic type [Nitrospiraceae bacterium]|tara:strand:- start:762 stop:2537 length:1776 start_codon:yes stop_codon:yes gene_type:complete
MMNGSKIFIEALKCEGVDVIFGLPGGVVLKIFDELHQQSDIQVVVTRHEQGAGHMAEGYAKATGRPGIVLVTSGPGMTNIVTPLADAYMDSVPIIVFTGQVSTQLIGNDAFQEADNLGISRPCTKHNFLVRDVKDLARTIREAFHIATTGRPGPVLVDIPKDVSINTAEFKYPKKVNLRGYNPNHCGDKTQVTRAAEAISQAKRPIIYVGGGAVFSNAADEVKALAEIGNIPVDMTLMGLGVFPATHPLSLGMLGMHGSYTANMAIHHADLVIAVGSRFDDRVTGKTSEFCPKAKIIHIDIDPTSIRKVRDIEVHIPILGDVKAVLMELTQALKVSIDGRKKDLREPWWNQLRDWMDRYPLTYAQSDDEAIKPQYVIDRLYRLTTDNDPIVSTDVGQHQMWAAQYFKLEHPRRWLTSGGLGTMGFGFPAAMGAQRAYPGRLVLCVSGDGSFQMNLQELATAVLYKLPVKVAIINNHYHGMVRQWQDLFYEGRYASSYLSGLPDYVKLAEAYGALGLRATSPSDVDAVIQEAVHMDGPVLMDFEVSRSENCYPMIPAGGANNEMLLQDPPHLSPATKSLVGVSDDSDSVLTA